MGLTFIQIEKQNVLNALRIADPATKKVLTTLFGEKAVYEKVTDVIDNFLDVIRISGRNIQEFDLRPGEEEDELAYRQLKLIVEVLNEGWEPNYNEDEEQKWYCVFEWDPSVSAFRLACKKLGTDPKILPDTTMLDESSAKFILAIYMLSIIQRAIVGKWVTDYSNTSQRKWYCVFVWYPSVSAFRFGYADYYYSLAYAGSGARLSFKTEEQAIYFGTQFIDLWNKVLTR